MSQMKTLNTVI